MLLGSAAPRDSARCLAALSARCPARACSGIMPRDGESTLETNADNLIHLRILPRQSDRGLQRR
eukprot:7258213-Pyramimonas_sp.AAC.1